MEQALF